MMRWSSHLLPEMLHDETAAMLHVGRLLALDFGGSTPWRKLAGRADAKPRRLARRNHADSPTLRSRTPPRDARSGRHLRSGGQ